MLYFDKMDDTVLEHFWGGEGTFVAKIFNDGLNKILKGTLAPGASIGEHVHEGTSEIIFIFSGEGTVLHNGTAERIRATDCHYCKKGESHSLINDGKYDLVFYAVVPVQ